MSGKGSLRRPPAAGQLPFPASSPPRLSAPTPSPTLTPGAPRPPTSLPHKRPWGLKELPHTSPEQNLGLTYRFIAALFVFAPNGKHPRPPSAGDG